EAVGLGDAHIYGGLYRLGRRRTGRRDDAGDGDGRHTCAKSFAQVHRLFRPWRPAASRVWRRFTGLPGLGGRRRGRGRRRGLVGRRLVRGGLGGSRVVGGGLVGRRLLARLLGDRPGRLGLGRRGLAAVGDLGGRGRRVGLRRGVLG